MNDLDEVKAQEHQCATIANTFNEASVSDELRPTLEEYLSHWLASDECPLCGSRLNWSWALVHGATVCSCGYPGRFYHFVTDATGKEHRIVTHLWAHPREVSRQSETH